MFLTFIKPKMNILLTGGSGLLGQHLKIEADRPTHREMEITEPIIYQKDPISGMKKEYDLIIHAAAYTDVEKAETDRMKCFNTNVGGTLNLLTSFPSSPFVYISSEYANNPVNFYSKTKRWAEELVEMCPHYLIIRTLFKESPWKYDYAFEDAWTQGDTVEIIAPLIEKVITEWSRKDSRIVYIGTGRKRIIDIARKTKPNVKSNLTTDIKAVKIPQDYET